MIWKKIVEAGTMLRSGMILMIRKEARSGKSAYTIGKQLGISKNTARKYIERGEDKPPPNDRFSKLDAYKPLLHSLMNQRIFNCVVLLERLQGVGYEGGITILKEYAEAWSVSRAYLSEESIRTLLSQAA